MKTVSVVYTKVKLADTSNLKKYTFNTESEVKEGDLCKVDGYRSNLQVVNVYNKLFNFYDPVDSSLYETQPKLQNSLPEIKVADFTKI